MISGLLVQKNGEARVDVGALSEQIEAMSRRLAVLQQRAVQAGPEWQGVLEEAFQQLQISLEELRMTQETLQQQNQELAASYFEAAVERQRYQELFEFAPDGYVVTNLDGTIEEANQAAAWLLGVSTDLLRGKPIVSFVPTQAQLPFRAELARLRHLEGIQQWELEVKPHAGEAFAADITVGIVRDREGKSVAIRWLLRDVTKRKHAEEQLKYMTVHDALTGLYNRAFFEEELARLQKGRQFPVSIVMADVNGLKIFNDLRGHAIGDELLRRTARALKEACRAVDMVARIGGDEFALLLPSTEGHGAADALARIRHNLEALNRADPELSVSLALGAATVEKGEKLVEGLQRADTAMYQNKLAQRGQSPGI